MATRFIVLYNIVTGILLISADQALGEHGNLDVGLIINLHRYLHPSEIYHFSRSLSLAFPEMQSGVVFYNDIAKVTKNLNKSSTELSDLNISFWSYLGRLGNNTNTSAGLYVARTQLFNESNGNRPNAHNVAILITFNESSVDSMEETIRHAQDLQRDNIRLICIGIRSIVREDALSAISSAPHIKDEDYFVLPHERFLQNSTFFNVVIDILNRTSLEKTTVSPTQFTMVGEGPLPPLTTNMVGEGEDDHSKGSTPSFVVPVVVAVVIILLLAISIVSVILIKRRRKSRNKVSEDEVMQEHKQEAADNKLPVTYENAATDIYEEIIDEESKTRDTNMRDSVHTYEPLTSDSKPLTFERWMQKNNITPEVATKLKKQKITTIPDLVVLTEKDIEDLRLTIGERSRLRAALKRLVEN